jgi:predicted enzyme related to lactoylglutathione lyase
VHNEELKLGPIVIGVQSIEKALPFYTAVFGIRVESRDDHYLSARLGDGTHIELEEDSPHRFPNWEKHNVGTYKNSEFTVTNMDSLLKTVVNHGGTVVTPKTPRPWGGFGAEISDLDGNIFLISSSA